MGIFILQATKLKRRAKEMRAALETSSERQASTWKSFESTVRVLVEAGALEKGSLQATPLGQAARELSAENELWLAIVLTHSSSQVRARPRFHQDFSDSNSRRLELFLDGMLDCRGSWERDAGDIFHC